MTAHVIGIGGATGGVGASTLAAAVALRGATAGLRTVAVDSSRWGTSLAIALGMEGARGVHWDDLARSDGHLPGDELRDALPEAHDVRLLARDGIGPAGWAELPRAVVHHARRALAGTTDLVVVDLPPVGSAEFLGWASWCHVVRVVVGTRPTAVAVAPALRQALGALPGDAALVVRGTGAPAAPMVEAVEEVAGHPVVAVLDEDPAVGRCELEGCPVGSVAGPLRTAADEVLLGVVEAAS
ncbi:CpaE-like family protein [Kytococcus sp. Marseille-QA3725]